MDWLNELLTTINEYAKLNPILAGVVSMGITGTIGFIAVKAPKHILELLNTVFFLRFLIDNGGYGPHLVKYINTSRWFYEFDGFKYTRSYGHESENWGDSSTTGPGLGVHFIIYKGMPLWWRIYPIDSSGSERVKRGVEIKTFIIFRKRFINFIKEITSDKLTEFVPRVWSYEDKHWRPRSNLPIKSIDTIILNGTKKEDLIKHIQSFYDDVDWYRNTGVPHKLVILLYGCPGTGKTGLIKALANHFQRNLCPVHLHALTDEKFVSCIEGVPSKSFIVMEEIDTCTATLNRQDERDLTDQISELSPLNLSTILNTLQGVSELDGKVIFLTTNHPEKLDKALYRSSRVDEIVCVDYLNKDAVKRYMEMAYPNEFKLTDIDFVNTPIPGSLLESILVTNKRNYNGFIEDLKDKVTSGNLTVVLNKLDF